MKTTKREPFLTEMNRVVPWTKLCAVIEPYYPKSGNGRYPKTMTWTLTEFPFLMNTQWLDRLRGATTNVR